MVKTFGAGNHQPSAGVGESCRGHRRAQRQILIDRRALVVVPMLLTTTAAIQSELERLEIRYLGNTDANLQFALLTDFADASQQTMPEDAEYIDIIGRGIEELNRQYGAGRFFLFH